MTRRDLVATALMISGVYLGISYGASLLVGLAQWIPFVSAAKVMTDFRALGGLLAALVISGGIGVGAACLLLFHSEAIARRLVPGDSGNDRAFPCELDGLHAAAISIVGLMIGVRAFAQMLANLIQYFVLTHGPAKDGMLRVSGHPESLIPHAVSLAIGFVLFFKAGALAAYWRRRQDAARAANEAKKTDSEGTD